jgi:AraC-like DNA-binding protein
MGRPKVEIAEAQLKAIMRLNPTMKDTAAFFECSEDTIERQIKRDYGLTFAEFREKNMVHTRFALVRKAIQKATAGDNVMLIFVLKNLCKWKDRYDHSPDEMTNTIPIAYVPKSLRGTTNEVTGDARHDAKEVASQNASVVDVTPSPDVLR